MPKYDIRPLQLRILNVMQVFHDVCVEHGLKYYLWAGTMLGAVRHSGFIPWDDDADVAMPRRDYDELVKHAKEWLPAPMELTCLEYDSKFTGTFAKMVDSSTTVVERYDFKSVGGVFMDIFPLDGMPSNRIVCRLQFMRYRRLCRLAYFCNRNPYKHGHGTSSWIPLIVQKFHTNYELQSRAIRLCRKYDYDKCRIFSGHDGPWRDVMPRSYVGEPVPIEFEGRMFWGVSSPDSYLTHVYGDYMTLPPEEKRRQHDFYYLNYDLPYREYNDERAFMK